MGRADLSQRGIPILCGIRGDGGDCGGAYAPGGQACAILVWSLTLLNRAALPELTPDGSALSAHNGLVSAVPLPLAGVPRMAMDFPDFVLDPITKLLSFPSFHESFPRVLRDELAAGRRVGLAIGDVDDMKKYVECVRRADERRFGHLAGNELMSQLGATALEWFQTAPLVRGCLSTFGGDEIIFAASGETTGIFRKLVRSLADTLSDNLPRTVSFACGTFEADPACRRAISYDHYVKGVVLVDRALFRAKRRGVDGKPRVVALEPRVATEAGWRTPPRRRRGGRGFSGEGRPAPGVVAD